MARLFGTDGVRGVANTELTCELAYRLGQAAAVFLGKNIVVGKDTRLSGDMLESALAAGIMSAGGTELSVGIIPTPAVALLVRELHADGGAVISASHNPPEYSSLESVFCALFSVAFFGEALTPRMALGFALIFASVVATQLGDKGGSTATNSAPEESAADGPAATTNRESSEPIKRNRGRIAR